MPDRALDLARRRVEALCNAGIKLLRDAADQLRLGIYHADRFAQEMVALDMRRDADGEKDRGDLLIEAFFALLRREGDLLFRVACVEQVLHASVQELGLDRLQHNVAGPLGERALEKVVVMHIGDHDDYARLVERFRAELLEQIQPIQLRHD